MNLLASVGNNSSFNSESRAARSMTVRALLLMAGLSTPALGQFRDWQTGDGNWSVAGNWTPNGVPLSTETARIGNLAGAINDTVYLDQNDTVAGLQIWDGMGLDLDGFQLLVNGDTLISGENFDDPVLYRSRITVRPGAAATEFQTSNLTLTDGGTFRSQAGSVSRVLGEFSTQDGCGMYAEGTVHFHLNGVRAFNNNSIIQVMGPSLTLNQVGTAQMDLDGTGGTGRLHVGAYGTHQLNVVGTGLTDPFSSEITLSPGHTLNMALASGWSTDSASDVHANGGGEEYPDPSIITGGPMSVGGLMRVSGTEGHLRIQSQATVLATAEVQVGQTDLMTFENDVNVEGGAFTVAEGGVLRFEGGTLLEGGEFTTFSGEFVDGGIVFAGPTDWFGNVSINGAARQNAEASVVGPTVIDAVELDMDGGGGVGASTWNIGSGLILNVDRIDQEDGGNDNGRFDGTINISSGITSRLTVNFNDPSAYWRMDGAINMTGNAIFFLTQLGGARVYMSGELNQNGGRSQINSDMTIATGSGVHVGPASAILRMDGAVTVYPASFTGDGLVQNSQNGEMLVLDATDFNGVGLVNEGNLTLHLHGAHVLVDRFQQTADGELELSVAGYTPGVEHDLLQATDGTAQLDGQMNVELGELAGVQFYPQPGDEFIVITADDGIVGAFDADPVTIFEDLTFQWDLEYNGFNVTLRLVSVTPACAGDANGDGMVNGLDLSVLLAQFGQNIEQWSGADFNGDGLVSGADLSVLLANFGSNCFPT